MPRYKIQDTRVIVEGDTPAAVVWSLMSHQWMSSSKSDYMNDAAERVLNFYGVKINATSPTDFVADLVGIGLLKPTK